MQFDQLKRRTFITLIGGVAAWPLAARAQQGERMRRIGVLMHLPENDPETQGRMRAFLQGLQQLGWTEGRNLRIDYRFGAADVDRARRYAAELIGLEPEVIQASGTGPMAAVQQATRTVPIVFAQVPDPVNAGFVDSLARPGGNVTGVEPYVPGLPAKQMEFAREIAPAANRVGLLTNLQDPKAPPQRQEMERAGEALKIATVVADANKPGEIEGALQTLASQRVDVVLVLQTTMLLNLGQRIAELAIEKRLPTVYGYREHVVAGGLISYGVDLRWCFRRTAYFVDKILRGTPPGDLPVEFPTKMVLSINLKTARMLGLEIPPTLLARADEVIE